MIRDKKQVSLGLDIIIPLIANIVILAICIFLGSQLSIYLLGQELTSLNFGVFSQKELMIDFIVEWTFPVVYGFIFYGTLIIFHYKGIIWSALCLATIVIPFIFGLCYFIYQLIKRFYNLWLYFRQKKDIRPIELQDENHIDAKEWAKSYLDSKEGE